MEDRKLIRLIQQNPDKGIHKAMQLYGTAVNTICRSVLQGCEEGLVDEAVSDTFFKLWKNSQQFSLEKGFSLKSWLYSIARNTAIDIRRKNGYSLISLDEKLEQEPISDVLVEKEVQKKEVRQILHEVIGALGEPDSQVFLLKYFLYMKNKEIATRLQISEKKTENILYRGKLKLKEMLLERGITCYED
ncbi:MAG: RNA polymerase sigma factor [Lachnospiraceae bacterium]|nr:RNA polymerase sigma factor [Lachnospiraceae bacterium]